MTNQRQAGEDKLSPSLLKNVSGLISTPLAHLINKSFACGQFLNDLKVALGRPYTKKGDAQFCDSYI